MQNASQNPSWIPCLKILDPRAELVQHALAEDDPPELEPVAAGEDVEGHGHGERGQPLEVDEVLLHVLGVELAVDGTELLYGRA